MYRYLHGSFEGLKSFLHSASAIPNLVFRGLYATCLPYSERFHFLHFLSLLFCFVFCIPLLVTSLLYGFQRSSLVVALSEPIRKTYMQLSDPFPFPFTFYYRKHEFYLDMRCFNVMNAVGGLLTMHSNYNFVHDTGVLAWVKRWPSCRGCSM